MILRRLIVLSLPAVSLACAAKRPVPPPVTTGEAAARGPAGAIACSRPFEASGEAVPVDQLPAGFAEQRRLAPRGDSPAFVPGTHLVAWVDRQSGDLRVADLRGGSAHPLVQSRPSEGGAQGAPSHVPGSAIRPRVFTNVEGGERPRELRYRSGGNLYRVLVPEEGPAAPERNTASSAPDPFRDALAKHRLPPGAYVVPVTRTLAAVVVGEGPPAKQGLYALDTSTGRLRPALPAGIGVSWAPQRAGDRQVLFGGSDGRYHLLDLESLALRCASARMPEGYQPGPFALSEDGRLLAYGARRTGPGGLPDYLVGLANQETRTDRRHLRAPALNALVIEPIPTRSAFLVSLRRQESSSFHYLDGAGWRRLTREIAGAGAPDVSAGAVVFARERPVTEIVPTPRPPEQMRDRLTGCDPVGPLGGGCGWVSNGCDWIWMGPCVKYVAPPDPADGIYLMSLDDPEEQGPPGF